MRRKKWTVLPIYLLFVGLMLLMSVGTYNYNKILSLIEVGISILSLLIVLIVMLNFRKYIRTLTHSAIETSVAPDQKTLESMKLPAAVTGDYGEIMLYNNRFRKAFLDGEEGENVLITPFIGDNDVKYVVRANAIDTEYKGKRYTVYARSVENGALFAFVDNTYYKHVVDEFNETKKSVGFITFDNVEDFSNDGDQEAMTAQITAENALYRWATTNNALIRRLSDRRYMIVFEEKMLARQIENKFRILDTLRAVTYNGRSATVSIGIGHGCETMTDSAAQAKKALDMALGRGGDQVALLTDGEYEFFGGVSKGVEKTSKVKVRVISESIKSAINGAERVLVMGHKYSDLDCIGAAAGMYALVTKKFGKPCYIVTDTERTLAKGLIERLQKGEDDVFISVERAQLLTGPRTLIFIVDTHSPDFVESERVYKACGNVIVIDHHRKMVNYIDTASVFFHEPSASSASELVTEIAEYLGDECIDHIVAEALLSGIMLDTKNFVINTGVRTFEAAAYLRKKGADTVLVRNMFANSLENYRDKAKLVAAAQIVNHCAITVAQEMMQNARIVCAQAADDLLSIEDTYASFVISSIDLHTVNISARSFGKINVQVIMEKLGGGGHQTMAAAQLTGVTLDEAKQQLIKVLKSQEVLK